jgi:hypothetical protein
VQRYLYENMLAQGEEAWYLWLFQILHLWVSK